MDTRMKLLICLLFCTAFSLGYLITPYSLIAQPTATSLASPTTTSEKIFENDFDNWELEMSENSYALNQSLKNKTRLLKSYEKVLIKRCFKELHATLIYNGPSNDPICNKFIGNTFNLDQFNYLAICARDGIDSTTCKEAAISQKTNIYSPSAEEDLEEASLDDVIKNKRDEPRIEQESNKLKTQIERIITADPRKKKASEQMKARSHMTQLLNMNCSRNRISLKENENTAPEPTPTTKSIFSQGDPEIFLTPTPSEASSQTTPSKDPYSNLFNDSATRTPIAIESKSARVYEITNYCNAYIEYALKYDKRFAHALCYKHGFYTPLCIEAKRWEKNNPFISDTNINPVATVKAFATF
jgi:hypothetical protein